MNLFPWTRDLGTQTSLHTPGSLGTPTPLQTPGSLGAPTPLHTPGSLVKIRPGRDWSDLRLVTRLGLLAVREPSSRRTRPAPESAQEG